MIWWRCSIKICAYTQTHTKLHNIFANAHTPVLNIEQLRKKWRKSSIPIKSVTSFFFVLFCYVLICFIFFVFFAASLLSLSKWKNWLQKIQSFQISFQPYALFYVDVCVRASNVFHQIKWFFIFKQIYSPCIWFCGLPCR